MELEYFRIHNWLSYYYGKANKCENENCKAVSPKRHEWALLKGKDHKRNRNNYIQLCPSCHRKYDYTQEHRNKISLSKKGKSAKNKCSVILNNNQIFESITLASKLTGVSISSIHNNIKGLSKTTKKGKWEYQLMN
jgi:hypothetical protein